MIAVRHIALAGILALGLFPDAGLARTVRSAHFVITHPDRVDISGLADALERGYRTVKEFGLRLPASIAVTVHASTGEFAARSGAGRMHLAGVRGSTLHLQPVGVLFRQSGLERALAHELVHVALAGAAGRMPRWLSEGVAMTIAGELHPVQERYSSASELDRALAEARSHDAARLAYGAAGRLVGALRAQLGPARMLTALRAIVAGRNASTAFRNVAGIDLDTWAADRLAGPEAARPRPPR